MKFVNLIFPIVDQLYILQAMEYQTSRYLKWQLKHFWARNLQRKHTIDWTPKAKILLILSLLIWLEIVILPLLGIYLLDSSFSIQLIVVITLVSLLGSPIYLSLAQLLFHPVEVYKKNQIVAQVKLKRERLKKLKVIAITGSYAKTSTKDILYTLLWKDFRVVKTPKSFNTLLGVARTFLSEVKVNTEIFLVEMDAYSPREIAEMSNLLSSDIGVITAIAPQHLERFSDMETLAKSQFEICESLKSKNGVLILNSDDEWSMKLQRVFDVEKKFAGEDKNSDFHLINTNQTESGKVKITEGDENFVFNLPLQGKHHGKNFVLAFAIARILKISPEQIEARVKYLQSTPHRLQIKKNGSMTIIDNSYNSNSSSYKASLELLSSFEQQKIIITPGLIELGQLAFSLNEQFGRDCAKVANDIFVVGDTNKEAIKSGLVNFDPGKVVYCKTTNQALELLKTKAVADAVVLIENDLPDQYD